MERNSKYIILASCVAVLYGCANSASHKVVKTEKIGDMTLSCSELRTEKRKAQIIIDGVEQDKADMTGADVVDGLLWFPFNVIAKQSNYSSATQAAEDRISHLTSLEVEAGCKSRFASKDEDNLDLIATRQLRQLNNLYKEGVLTKEEYIAKRIGILSAVDSPAPDSEVITKQSSLGQYSHYVEQIARRNGCGFSDGARLLSKTGPIELYKVKCLDTSSLVIRCEYQDCKILK